MIFRYSSSLLPGQFLAQRFEFQPALFRRRQNILRFLKVGRGGRKAFRIARVEITVRKLGMQSGNLSFHR